MATPKTSKVVLRDGREGRGVKLSARNFLSVKDWVDGDKFIVARVLIRPGKPDTKHEIKLRTEQGVRVAKIDDIIVKLKNGRNSSPTFVVIRNEEISNYIKV